MKYFVIQGVIGALLSLVLITLFIGAAFKNIPELREITDFGSFAKIYLMMVIIGVLLTTISTYFSMRKYLRADVDELYE